MAQGDVVVFNQFWEDVGDKLHNLSSDTFKMGIVTNATVPAATTADPRWGAGGTTNFSTNQVTPGGNYATGGPIVADGTPDAWTRSGATTTFDLENVSILQNVSNPSGAYWGIIYNDTDTGKRCAGYIDLGGPIDLSAGDFTITWNANGMFQQS